MGVFGQKTMEGVNEILTVFVRGIDGYTRIAGGLNSEGIVLESIEYNIICNVIIRDGLLDLLIGSIDRINK